jgi:hypothetical protein
LGIVSILGVALSKPPLDSAGVPEEFWFNVKTGKVEFGKLAPATYRIGPFESQEDAKRALEIIANRSKKWSEELED